MLSDRKLNHVIIGVPPAMFAAERDYQPVSARARISSRFSVYNVYCSGRANNPCPDNGFRILATIKHSHPFVMEIVGSTPWA